MKAKKHLISLLVGIAITGIASVSYAEEPDIESKHSIIEENDLELTEEEISILKRKKHLLKRFLQEEDELNALRTMMKDKDRKRSFDEMIKQENPYSDEEIIMMRKNQENRTRARNKPLKPITMKNRIVELDLEGNQIIDVNIARGYVSSLVFFDQTGAPWAIEDDILGDDKAFKSHKSEKHDHIGVIEITREFVESNAIVKLKGMAMPIVFRLTGDSREIDSRLSIRVPKNGPDAVYEPFVSGSINNASKDLLAVLNDNKLANSKSYRLVGAPGDVFYKDNTLYIRTSAEIMSPPVDSWAKSPSGNNVYQMVPATELLMLVDGQMTTARVEAELQPIISKSKSIFSEE